MLEWRILEDYSSWMACKTRRYIPRMGRISCHCLHCFTRVDGGLKEHNLLDSLRHSILFGSVADPQQSKVDNQEQRVFLPTNLDWRMHVYNNRYMGSFHVVTFLRIHFFNFWIFRLAVEKSSSFVDTYLPFSDTGKFFRRLQRTQWQPDPGT